MATTLSKLMSQFSASPTAALMARVAALREQGKTIISLNIGEPDFPTPDNIKEAGIKAINDDFTKYTPVAGILPLRQAIAKKLSRDNHIDYDVSEIAVSVGAKQAIVSAVMAIAGEGDEIIVPTPCYVSYPDIIKMAFASPVMVPLTKDTCQLDIEAIEKAITKRTKAIIICTPNNPTGTAFDEASLRELARIALAYDLFVITDEIYEKLTYYNFRHVSIASLSKDMKDHTITINGFSKTYAMTGWRLGYVAARQDVIKAIIAIESQVTTAPASMVQMAGIEALEGPQDAVSEMVKEYEKRMIYCRDRLRAIPGVTCMEAQGAFYLFPDISHYIGTRYKNYFIENDSDLCNYILETQYVCCVPGSVFYGPGHIRISYSRSLEELKQAMDGIEKALSLLK